MVSDLGNARLSHGPGRHVQLVGRSLGQIGHQLNGLGRTRTRPCARSLKIRGRSKVRVRIFLNFKLRLQLLGWFYSNKIYIFEFSNIRARDPRTTKIGSPMVTADSLGMFDPNRTRDQVII